MKHCFLLLSLLLFLEAKAQYPSNYFTAPLDTPLIIVGSFGEIRNDHFHMGIDLSTGEQEGVPVMAAAEGFVSRIKISNDGYGKALYITHPNGYVTVYGHLQKFTPALNELVRKMQYEKQSYEIDETLSNKEVKLKKGEVIGYSGSSGSAEGPHLHFEIRHEETEEPINPLHFGLTGPDTIPPTINYIRVYPLAENGIVNKTDTATTYEVMMSEGVNYLNTLDYIQVFGTIMFGINATDRVNNSNATLGVYSVELYIDRNLAYQWQYDRLNFDESRYVNAHTDYMTHVRDRLTIERAFRLPGNHMNLGDTSMTGYQFFTEDVSHDIRFVVRDFAGNKTVLEFQALTYASLSSNQYQRRSDDALLVTPQKGIAVHKQRLDVSIPSGAVYQDFYYTDAEAKSESYASNIFKVGNYYEAVHNPITVGIKPNAELADSIKSKAVIAQLFSNNTLKSWGGKWNGKFLSANVRSFGDFVIAVDTVGPKVEKDYVPADMNTVYGGVVRIKVSDDLSGIKSYSVKIDNRWWLFEYNKKLNLLIGDLSAVDLNKKHPIEVTVVDERGNTTVWKSDFYY